jgi:CRISPR-associated protein Csm1
MNVIYAGGDDLFIIGRWDKLINFAELIHKKTEEYFRDNTYWENTIDNNGNNVRVEHRITISGGIAIVNPKFPIAKGAESAGEAEDMAKSFRNGEKNALCFLGKTVSWNTEFAYVKSYQLQFTSLIQNYGLSKGILHKLMLYASIADQNKVKKREGEPEDFSYVWHISYYLTRFINRYKSNEEVCAFCRQLRDKDIDYKKGRNLELIALAARWAELLLRDTNN